MNTIVSAFISNVNYKYDNSPSRYYELGKLLLQSNVQKIIFVDNTMSKLIGENYDKKNTLIIEVDKKDIYLYDYISHLVNFRINSTDHNKDTIEYMITICGKTEWIRKAIELNYFNTENFIWIDFGIRHVFKCSDDQFVEKINSLKFKVYKNIRIGGIWNINSIYNMNIYKDIAWYFAGGVFGGNKDQLTRFADLMKMKCIEIMATKNTLIWEVNIWYLLYNDYKYLFDIYNCDHNDTIIDNY